MNQKGSVSLQDKKVYIQEINEMEQEEDSEKVLVPARRRGPIKEEVLLQEIPTELDEVRVPVMLRRWYAY